MRKFNSYDKFIALMTAVANNIITPVDARKRQNLNIRTGDTVRVYVKVEEKGKTRLQIFEGIVLARKHGNEPGATFTVRRRSSGVGVERIFPLYSPVIEKIEVIKRAKVRQSNLYYIRDKAAREVRRQMKRSRIVSETDTEQEGEPEQPIEEQVSTEGGSQSSEQATEATEATEAAEAQPETTETTETTEDTSEQEVEQKEESSA